MVHKISSIEKSVSIGGISISQGEIDDFYKKYHQFLAKGSIYNQYGEITDLTGEVLLNDMLFVNYQLFIASLPDDSIHKNISQSDYKTFVLSGDYSECISRINIPNCLIDSKKLLGFNYTIANNEISNVKKLILASIFSVGLFGSANMFFNEKIDSLEKFQGYTYLAGKRIFNENIFSDLKDIQLLLEKDFQNEIEYRRNEYFDNFRGNPDVNVVAIQNGPLILVSVSIIDKTRNQTLKHFSFSLENKKAF